MYHSAQQTDILVHICSARTQEVAHRVVQVKHGPSKTFGLINNRVIVGNQPSILECGISLNIYEQVSFMIGQITDTVSSAELARIKTDIVERLKELYSIDKELQCFQHSIYYPVIRDMKEQRSRLKVITICSSSALILSILQCVFDLKTLIFSPPVYHWFQNAYLILKELVVSLLR